MQENTVFIKQFLTTIDQNQSKLAIGKYTFGFLQNNHMNVPSPHERVILQDGSIKLFCETCTVLYLCPSLGVIVIQMSGRDCVQIDTAIFDELHISMLSHQSLEVFIDISEAVGHALNINGWTHFLTAKHQYFRQIHILVTSKVLHLSVLIIKHLARATTTMQIHTRPEIYNELLDQAVKINRDA
jgi:hypothetical protein